MTQARHFADGLHLAECPRWYAGHLWVSDMWGHTVYRFDADGTRHVAHRFDDEPGGLGWLPDGRLLVVGMAQRQLLRMEANEAVVHADLTVVAPWPCNDMIVTDDGTAYVTQFGYDMWGGTTGVLATTLIRVRPDGRVDTVADDMWCPNGIALSGDGTTLVVAEPAGSRITSFALQQDGTLTDRQVFAQLTPVPGEDYAPPDGLCLDAAGAVWVAEPLGKRVLRIEPGGRVSHTIPFESHPLAVALGGPNRRTLFVCLSPRISKAHGATEPMAGIRTVDVDVPGNGRP